MPNSKFTFDASTDTASFELFANNAYITMFNYANGIMTFAARANDATFTVEQYIQSLGNLRYFSKNISLQLSPPSTLRGDFTERIEKADTLLYALFKNGTASVTDATYDKTAGTIVFLARDAVTMTFTEFLKFVEFFDKLESSILQMG